MIFLTGLFLKYIGRYLPGEKSIRSFFCSRFLQFTTFKIYQIVDVGTGFKTLKSFNQFVPFT